ncbi:MAG: class I SAM-dependent RNA methyltransferase [Candidatus Saccharimonadaceae bacterium]
MIKKTLPQVEVTLEKIVGGGQALGTLEDGRKIFVWGGLPEETVQVQLTKKKSKYAEGVVTEVLKASKERVEPKDADSYISTSPWQIMSLETENRYKAALIEEAFELHDIVLPNPIEVYSDGVEYGYRNKVEYSFWHDNDTNKLSLAFFRRGTHGKIPVEGTSLATDVINVKAAKIVDTLNELGIEGRALKTLLIRSNAKGEVTWQLYVKEKEFNADAVLAKFDKSESAEIFYSNPLSPASVITKRLSNKVKALSDTILDVPFSYATEGFFQINLPVYEQALKDMSEWIVKDKQTVDLYSGVGSIGLTIGGDDVTLVELNEYAVHEMKQNIYELKKKATAVLAASEQALDYIKGDKTIIVDPPRVGLHDDVVWRLIDEKPQRIIYLSCNPVTQARDIAKLTKVYGIKAHRGYNFFPHTPHIEHLVVLDLY